MVINKAHKQCQTIVFKKEEIPMLTTDTDVVSHNRDRSRDLAPRLVRGILRKYGGLR